MSPTLLRTGGWGTGREHGPAPDRCHWQMRAELSGSSQDPSLPCEEVTALFGTRRHQESTVEISSDAVPTWDEIVELHSDRVFRLAYRLTGNRPDAEDLTQEVFVRVFRSLSTYQPGTFEGWIHRITTNLFLDQARRKQRIRFDALSDERADRLTSASASPDAAYADRTFDDDVELALASLPPEFRAAVVLCDVEGLSYQEIADIMDAKLGTVRSRIHRGRAMLREALAHRAPAEGRQRYAGPALPGPVPTGGLAAGPHDRRSPRQPRQRPPRRSAGARRGGPRLAARARLPLLPRPRRARGLGQDPPRRAVARRHPARPTGSRTR